MGGFDVRRNTLAGELAAEFLGTLVLLLFGTGVVGSVVAAGRGDANSISFAWGFAVTMGVYVAGGLSGAHLNPAVTVALAARGDVPWGKVGPYILAQLVGAFCGAGLVLLHYSQIIGARVNGTYPGVSAKATLDDMGGIFYTRPNLAVHAGGDIPWAFFSELLGTFILMFVIRAITDTRNSSPVGNMAPLLIGFLVAVIGMSLGATTGYAINPARDLGPRLLAALGGWGAIPFTDNGGYFWIPIVAPIVGAVLGIFAYDFGIRQFLIDKGEQPLAGEQSKAETVRERR